MHEVRNVSHVGLQWVENFIQQQKTLKMQFQCKIDYQKILTEDPSII